MVSVIDQGIQVEAIEQDLAQLAPGRQRDLDAPRPCAWSVARCGSPCRCRGWSSACRPARCRAWCRRSRTPLNSSMHHVRLGSSASCSRSASGEFGVGRRACGSAPRPIHGEILGRRLVRPRAAETTYAFRPAFPPGHFVSDIIAYVGDCTDAALEYHEAGALVLLATATPRVRVRIRFSPEGARHQSLRPAHPRQPSSGRSCSRTGASRGRSCRGPRPAEAKGVEDVADRTMIAMRVETSKGPAGLGRAAGFDQHGPEVAVGVRLAQGHRT
jgi:hypothetical protein